jgi:hypothetical protein
MLQLCAADSLVAPKPEPGVSLDTCLAFLRLSNVDPSVFRALAPVVIRALGTAGVTARLQFAAVSGLQA